jgi:AAA domain
MSPRALLGRGAVVSLTCTRCHERPGLPRREHAERVLCDRCAARPPLVDWEHPPERFSYGELEEMSQRATVLAGTAAPTTNGATPAGESFALSLDDFITAESDTPPALIGESGDVLLPAGGLIIMGGAGGKGKTTLAVDAVFHLAAGRDWLGFPVPRPLRVLVIENEGPREMFRRKLEAKRASWPHGCTGAIYVSTLDWGALDLRDDGKRQRLRAFIEEHEIDLVVGDPLDSCGLDGIGSPDETRRFMELAKDVGLHRTVAFWFLHHPRKDKADDELDQLSGAWGGRPDSVLMLSLLAGDRSRLSLPKVRWGRHGKRPALILGFDADTEGFERLAEEGEERDYATEMEALFADGEWRTMKEIRAPKDDAKPGIAAGEKVIRDALEAGEAFISRPGGEVGRHPTATVWGLSAWVAGADLLQESAPEAPR